MKTLSFMLLLSASTGAAGDNLRLEQIPQICVQSAQQNHNYMLSLSGDLLDQVAGQNLAFNGPSLSSKISAYSQIFKNPMQLDAFKFRIYTQDAINRAAYPETFALMDRSNILKTEMHALKEEIEARSATCVYLSEENVCPPEFAKLRQQYRLHLQKTQILLDEFRLAQAKPSADPAPYISALRGLPIDIPAWLAQMETADLSYPADLPAITKTKVKEESRKSEIFASAANFLVGHVCDLVFSASEPERDKKLSGCRAAAKFLTAQAAPTEVSGVQTSFVPTLVRTLTEPIYRKALAHMALLVIRKSKAVLDYPERYESGKGQFGDLQNDLVASFLWAEPLGGPELALKRAWEFLGLYGGRGAGFSFESLTSQENISVPMSMQIIAAGLQVLTRASLHSGKLYAYPRFVSTNCEYGRPYHFWMGAYLAHIAMADGRFSREDIFAAIHGLRVAYKLVGPTSLWQTYFMNSRMRFAYVREVQKDFVFGALGVRATLLSKSQLLEDLTAIPIDPLLLYQMKASNFSLNSPTASVLDGLPLFFQLLLGTQFSVVLPTSFTELARGDRAWTVGVAPNAAFNVLRARLPDSRLPGRGDRR